MFARSLSTLAHVHSMLARRWAVVVAFVAVVLGALTLAASAEAVVTTVEGTTVGVAPRISDAYLEGGSPKTYANPNGNPVLHGTNVYAVYWDPTDHYWSEWQSAIDEYFQNAGTASGNLESVFAVDGQYTDKSDLPASYAQAYKGSYVDSHAYPASGCTDPAPFNSKDQIPREIGGAPEPLCLTDTQVADELEAFITAHGLPRGMSDVYYLLTPPGLTVCLGAGGAGGYCSDYTGAIEGESYEHSFCSYHSDINPGGLASGSASTIVYAVIPWTAGGYGDSKLKASGDRRPGWDCQDGGIWASGKGYKLEEVKERDKVEEEAFEKLNAEEKEAVEEAKKLEGPHEQEPNQQKCPSTAGTCDYGLSDLIINQISLEQENMVTNPLLNAWQDANHYENTDECRFLFGATLGGSVTATTEGAVAGTLFDQTLSGHNYYLNDAFSLAAERLPYPGVPCIHAVNLDPKFTAPNTVKSGEIVDFDGMESDIALDAGFSYSSTGAPQANYATYTWNFGDGTGEVTGYAPGSPACETPLLSPCAASVFHSYEYGGTYPVTLTVKDVGDNVASVTEDVTVVGPAPPSTSGTGAGGAGSSSGTSGGSTGTATGPGAPGSVTLFANPVAAAAIVPEKLKSALRKGLVVTYSVNEQVAGRFEVLLSSALAHRLHISGTPATGLPAGSPAEMVIAKAILVTTKGGRSAVHIKFSKSTAARLSHAKKVPLMLRLTVRNAASTDPATTTVVSAITLAG
jgi:hypothetical protein